MYLYLFKKDDVKYSATAMSKVHKESTFKFTRADFETFDVKVGEAEKVFNINSFGDLGRYRDELIKDWGLKTYLVESRLKDLTFYKIMVWICGELFLQVEVFSRDEKNDKEGFNLWQVNSYDDLVEGYKRFNLGKIDKKIKKMFNLTKK